MSVLFSFLRLARRPSGSRGGEISRVDECGTSAGVSELAGRQPSDAAVDELLEAAGLEVERGIGGGCLHSQRAHRAETAAFGEVRGLRVCCISGGADGRDQAGEEKRGERARGRGEFVQTSTAYIFEPSGRSERATFFF